jgi:uncharacterized protein (TIGR01777 family)
VSARRVAVTGATGLIGRRLIPALRERGWQTTVLSRDPARAREKLGEIEAVSWDPLGGPAPAAALIGHEAVVHLAGAPVDQRWSAAAKREIHDSRVHGTRNLVEGLRLAGEGERPRTLVSSSAIGYYGARGEEPLDEDASPGGDFLAQVCVEWEAQAAAAARLGVRVVQVRTGVVLDTSGGALSKMLPPFRLGIGGPVAGGRQYMSWIHADDVAGIYVAALDGGDWRGPVNATAPEPATNRDFSRALGRALRRPAVLPIPGLAIRALYGEMAAIVTTGQRALPRAAEAHGYAFAHPQLDEALRAALG